MKNIGELGPSFALSNQNGEIIILDRLLARNEGVVVYFFPQAGAPGCTREALGFRDLLPQFQAHKIAIVGVTQSRVAELDAFAKEQGIPFDLCSDPSLRTMEEWGTKRGDNIARSTFVLNEKGLVTHAFPRVDVFKHPAEVLALFGAAPTAPTAAAAPVASPAPAIAGSSEPAPVGTVSTAAPAGNAVELTLAAARGSLGLLQLLQQSGTALPADVVALCAKLAGR